MTGSLITPAELAAEFKDGKTARWVLESRLKYGWPCVKVGRVIRFTPEQVEEIVRRHTTQEGAGTPALDGQTARSRRAS
jgi:hypothetical protein